MLDAQRIKELYEFESGILDLSVKNRKRLVADVRFCYFKSCKNNLSRNVSLSSIGKLVKRDHATVLHGLKQYDNNYGKDYFLANDIYEEVEKKIYKIKHNLVFLQEGETNQDWKANYKNLMKRSELLINDLKSENEELKIRLRHLPTFFTEAINNLSQDDYQDFIQRNEVFFKVKNKLNLKP
jgi:hypothetical protein